MKAILTLALLAIVASCDTQEKLTGYIVAKEYTPAHMSNETVPTYSFAAFVPVAPSKVHARYLWYVANKHRIVTVQLDSTAWTQRQCGDKVTVSRW